MEDNEVDITVQSPLEQREHKVLHHHQNREDFQYSMAATASFREPLDYQIMEKVLIINFNGNILMNRKRSLEVHCTVGEREV